MMALTFAGPSVAVGQPKRAVQRASRRQVGERSQEFTRTGSETGCRPFAAMHSARKNQTRHEAAVDRSFEQP